MRAAVLGVTFLFLAAFLGGTIYAAVDRGFTVLTILSLLVVGVLAVGILGALLEDPPDDDPPV